MHKTLGTTQMWLSLTGDCLQKKQNIGLSLNYKHAYKCKLLMLHYRDHDNQKAKYMSIFKLQTCIHM